MKAQQYHAILGTKRL